MQKKKIIITGGSGFIGSALAQAFFDRGYEVVILDLFPPHEERYDFVKANLAEHVPLDEKLQHPHAVIHLAGKNIFGKFTPHHKQEIYESRIIGTQNLMQLIKKENYKPQVFVAASAVGYYGEGADMLLSESSDNGTSFLAGVVRDWEHELLQAKFYHMRTVVFRQGYVLGNGGFLSAQIPLFKKFLGGPLGSGEQWLPWITLADLVRLYVEAVENNNVKGVYNAVARSHIQQKDFAKTLGKVLGRPAWFRVPRWVLALKFGSEFAQEMTASQRVVSHRLAEFDHSPERNHLEAALRGIVDTPPPTGTSPKRGEGSH